jgi:hypothetical protein
MPSLIPLAAILAAAAYPSIEPDDSSMLADDAGSDSENDDEPSPDSIPLPWGLSAWQKRTGIYQSPFSPTFEEGSLWKSAAEADAVRTFKSNFCATNESEQHLYIQRARKDNDALGRTLYLDFMTERWSTWKINDTVNMVLAERGLDPYTVMKRQKASSVGSVFLTSSPPPFLIRLSSPQLPDVSSAQVALAFPHVAEALFGPEAFTPDRVCLREPIKRIIDSLVIAEWGRARRSVVKERNKVPVLKAEINKGWQSEPRLRSFSKPRLTHHLPELIDTAEGGTSPQVGEVRQWLTTVDRLTRILRRYKDNEAVEQLKVQRKRL